MQPQLKQLGLTQLEKALPVLYETARQEQWTYETFMKQAIASAHRGAGSTRSRTAHDRSSSACDQDAGGL